MINWIKNLAKKQAEINPVIAPFFDESKGWRWFFRFYFLVTFLIMFVALIEFVLLMFGGDGLWLLSMLEEQDPQKKINTFGEWTLVVICFFYFFGTLIYIGRVFSISGKLTLEKKITPKINIFKYFIPRNNFFTNYVAILLFFYLLFALSSFVRQGVNFIASIFGEEAYIRIIAGFVIIWGAAWLVQPGILWLDKQKPLFIHTCFGAVVLLYFLSFVWLINYS